MGCASTIQICVLHNFNFNSGHYLRLACLGRLQPPLTVAVVATEHASDEYNRLVMNQCVHTIALKLYLSTTHSRGVLAVHEHISL